MYRFLLYVARLQLASTVLESVRSLRVLVHGNIMIMMHDARAIYNFPMPLKTVA